MESPVAVFDFNTTAPNHSVVIAQGGAEQASAAE
jgi:hypothetical protein